MPFAATSMGLEIIIISEVSNTEKDKYHLSLACGSYKIKDTNELVYKTETDSETENYDHQRGKGGGGEIRSVRLTDTNYYT